MIHAVFKGEREGGPDFHEKAEKYLVSHMEELPASPYSRREAFFIWHCEDPGEPIRFSYVSDTREGWMMFVSFMQRMVMALRRLGIDAGLDGSHGLVCGGLKVGEMSFMIRKETGVLRGALLLDCDLSRGRDELLPRGRKKAPDDMSLGNIAGMLCGKARPFARRDLFEEHLVRTLCTKEGCGGKEMDEMFFDCL